MNEASPSTTRGPIEVVDPRPDPQPLIPIGVHEAIVIFVDKVAPARLDEPSLGIAVANDRGEIPAAALSKGNDEVRYREQAMAGYPQGHMVANDLIVRVHLQLICCRVRTRFRLLARSGKAIPDRHEARL